MTMRLVLFKDVEISIEITKDVKTTPYIQTVDMELEALKKAALTIHVKKNF